MLGSTDEVDDDREFDDRNEMRLPAVLSLEEEGERFREYFIANIIRGEFCGQWAE